jgi:AcrR family transcriptional regulator
MEQAAVESRKNQILKAAGKCFANAGYNGTSVRDIAAEVGIEAASLYSHFSGKDEILREICYEKAKAFENALSEVNDLYFNAEEKLRMAINNHVRIITEDVNAAHVFLNEWKHLKAEDLENFKTLRHNYEEAFKQIITDGENENIFHESDKQFAVLTILSSVNWISEWYNPQGKLKPKEIADKITDFILKGLKKNN